MLKRILLFLLISITFFACEKDDDINNDNNSDNYNRSGMLIHWADNIIIPAYDAFYDKLIILDSSVDAFIENSNLSNHENLSIYGWNVINIGNMLKCLTLARRKFYISRKK